MPRKVKNNASSFEVKKLQLLVTIVNHGASDVYLDFFQSLEANLQLTILANGTIKKELDDLFGLHESKKDVILSIIREEKIDEAFNYIEQRFKLSEKHNGVAFTIKMNSLVGLSVYKILSNTLELKPNGGK